MPYALGAIQVQAGQSYTVPVGTAGTVGAVVVANESPYAVMGSAGSGGQWIVAQTADLIACNTSAFNGNLTLTTDNYLNNASSAPSFLLYLTAFAPGEPIRGTYPAPLVRLASGGSVGIATQVINDNSPSGSTVLETRPSGGLNSLATIDNNGAAQFASLNVNGDSVLTAGSDYNALTLHNPAVTTQAILGSADNAYVNGAGFFIFTGGGPDGYVMRNWDGTGGTISGAIKSLGQQATVGSFGVPVIVAQAIDVHVTATGNQNILAFTPAVNGLYRISGHVHWSNGSSSAVVASVSYNDAHGSASAQFLSTSAGGTTTPLLLSGSNSLGAGTVSLPLNPLTIYAATSLAITCKWNDPTGTPNDFVSYIIERLA